MAYSLEKGFREDEELLSNRLMFGYCFRLVFLTNGICGRTVGEEQRLLGGGINPFVL